MKVLEASLVSPPRDSGREPLRGRECIPFAVSQVGRRALSGGSGTVCDLKQGNRRGGGSRTGCAAGRAGSLLPCWSLMNVVTPTLRAALTPTEQKHTRPDFPRGIAVRVPGQPVWAGGEAQLLAAALVIPTSWTPQEQGDTRSRSLWL